MPDIIDNDPTLLASEPMDSRSVAEFTEQAYLNYAMYVIMDRSRAAKYRRRPQTGTAPYRLRDERAGTQSEREAQEVSTYRR